MDKILITGHLFPHSAYQKLIELGYSVTWVKEYLEPGDLRKELKYREIYIMAGREIATAQVLKDADKLGLIVVLATACSDFVDIQTATKKGIYVAGTPGISSESVAEMTIGLMIATFRNIVFLSNGVRSGNWIEEPRRSISGKVLGIIGLGSIGTKVAEIARAGLNMEVAYFSPHQHQNLEAKLGLRYIGIDELFACSDAISLHCPLTDATKFIVSDGRLSKMKKEAILINTSRAWLVEPRALLDALMSGTISAAAFDVYYIEPAPPADQDPFGLLRLPENKFIITPHTAYLTEEKFQQMALAAVSIVNEWIKGHPK